MAAPKQNNPTSPDTAITIKVTVNDVVKKLKLPLRDLSANILPAKLRSVLDVKPDREVIIERYSDSIGGYITLDENNPQVFKTLIRAAKAKLKLRLKVTVLPYGVSADEPALPAEPQMVQTSTESFMNNNRDSKALDRRSVGSGIFQFKEARASQQTLVNDDVPVPQPFVPTHTTLLPTTKALPLPPIAPVSQPTVVKAELPATAPKSTPSVPAPKAETHAAWSVYCNACDSPMPNKHFHCSICDDGDYDLCEKCVTAGKMCPGEGHWLIKRSIVNGQVVSGITEQVVLVPKKKSTTSTPATAISKEPRRQISISKDIATTKPAPVATRTCNSCVVIRSEHDFVTCSDCDDFDLCVKCHTEGKHGHHPAHTFKRATAETVLPLNAATKLKPGRNVRHNAVCDGCEKMIYGVRHKCLSCPDWDYCNDCVKAASVTHPQHRFAPLFEPLVDQQSSGVRHFGIFCDGPLCHARTNQSYIQGVRYKCTICHDTDFCAACEALPSNHHNRTHPMLKLKTPVRNVNISTEDSDPTGAVRVLGDRQPEAVATRSTATETTPVTRANAATQVQTVAEITPTEVKSVPSVESIRSIPLGTATQASTAVPIPVKKFVAAMAPATEIQTSKLNAHFVTDSVPDGFVFEPETRFNQVWTLMNPGPFDWPTGCSVRFVGGDNMLNVDNSHPASATELMRATESNVVAREVRVGEEVSFSVTLKAGKREGKSISYWRLKAADGTPFGHRLWCDIDVKRREAPSSAVPVMPTTLPIRPAGLPDMNMPHMTMGAFGAPSMGMPGMSMPGMYPPMMPSAMPDLRDMNARLAKMREAQKERRDQLASMMAAQREAQTNGTALGARLMAARQENADATLAKMQAEHREKLKQRVDAVKASLEEARTQREVLAREIESERKAAEAHDTEKEATLESSRMVFPKLEKESPSSSTYESLTNSVNHGRAAYMENDGGEVEQTAAHVTTVAPEATPSVVSASADEEGDFESVDNEIEVLSATGEESEEEEDGFVTDEEYDILDASDDETVASMK